MCSRGQDNAVRPRVTGICSKQPLVGRGDCQGDMGGACSRETLLISFRFTQKGRHRPRRHVFPSLGRDVEGVSVAFACPGPHHPIFFMLGNHVAAR